MNQSPFKKAFFRSRFAGSLPIYSIVCFLIGYGTGCAQESTKDSLASYEQLEKTGLSKEELARKGMNLILDKKYLPDDFDQETFDQVWRSWPKDLRQKAEQASADEIREMAFRRYGFTPRPTDPTKPLQFVVQEKSLGKPEQGTSKSKVFAMNCFACHGGSLYGSTKSYPGLPNNRIALETLYEDMRQTKRILKKPYSGMDIGSAIVPMGTTVGTSNAVVFGVSLMAFRDKRLDLKSFVIPPYVTHHDMDAPPWWNYKYRKMLYIDAFLEKHHRGLMPFIMVKDNYGELFRSYEPQFEIIKYFLESVEPPKYPHRVDREKADKGKVLFQANCAQCHGTYEPELEYPEKVIDLEEIGTDPVRLSALSKSYRKRYGESWLAEFGKVKTVADPKGYVAPPLVGIWASAPYMHNGSIPTLRAVIHPKLRPEIWTRKKMGFNEADVGLKYEAVSKVPSKVSGSERRNYFDTRRFGKSNSGHDFGEHLNRLQTDQLLEYLKTL